MRDALLAGIALYNVGEFHAAHDPWEAVWLDTDSESDDWRFLRGLIQFTAAMYHARNLNWAGVQGLAESGSEYLASVPGDYRGVNVDAVATYLAAVARDPEQVERRAPPGLVLDGDRVEPADLDFPAAALVAEALAEESEWDETVVADAIEYAERDLADGDDGSRFITLVMDFAAGEERPLVYQRLSQHVEKRHARERDVDDLF